MVRKLLIAASLLAIMAAYAQAKAPRYTAPPSGAVSVTSTTNIPLPQGATNYIQNTQSLQAGATFFVSSGTVQGPLSVLSINWPDGNIQQHGSSTRTVVLATKSDVLIATIGFNPQSVVWTNDAYSTWTFTRAQAFMTVPSTVAESQFNGNVATAPFGGAGGVGAFTPLLNSTPVVNANIRMSAPQSFSLTVLPNGSISLTIPVVPSSGTSPGGPAGIMLTGDQRRGP